MNTKNFIFAIATLGFLATSCSPQAIDEHTTQDNIKSIEKKDVKIPTNG
ncbi:MULTISPECIES: hypothetical protein [Mesonia]|uniref:Uncharacterized protein n=1 Tax=Mesonia algae TaxID=213248 RepID=A0A2W7ISF9_9FLAO|nr:MULTISPECIES: hypothetical protein [Mesonia]PZW42387.1 hypothetical protein LX95_00697 [Mesonia algae]